MGLLCIRISSTRHVVYTHQIWLLSEAELVSYNILDDYRITVKSLAHHLKHLELVAHTNAAANN